MDMFAALQAFVAVVDEGGFAPAARRAGQAPSSFTRHVDALEAALGTRLLARSTRQVSLTEAGKPITRKRARSLTSWPRPTAPCAKGRARRADCCA
ncbi:LysR family transcriptional regulator [Novosphingobium pokkalii]|uniref:helix-turn-helix domain-containing protein n=1 Tax=Novosphingobium pokkalii TaxID=1770194 RepID=UPI003638CDC5